MRELRAKFGHDALRLFLGRVAILFDFISNDATAWCEDLAMRGGGGGGGVSGTKNVVVRTCLKVTQLVGGEPKLSLETQVDA